MVDSYFAQDHNDNDQELLKVLQVGWNRDAGSSAMSDPSAVFSSYCDANSTPQLKIGPMCNGKKNATEENNEAVPNIALSWIVQNCSSNQELAIISNVCRSWRLAAVSGIQKLTTFSVSHQLLPRKGAFSAPENIATEAYIHSKGNMADVKSAFKQDDEHEKKFSPKREGIDDESMVHSKETLVVLGYSSADEVKKCITGKKHPSSTLQPPPLSRLLLPSMVREKWRRILIARNSEGRIETTQKLKTQQEKTEEVGTSSLSRSRRSSNTDTKFSKGQPPNSTTQSNLTEIEALHNEAKGETFCLSWFHPEGIELLPTESMIHTTERRTIIDRDMHRNCVEAGGYMVPSSQSEFNASLLGKHLLALEWKSYSKAIDILKPFGYALSFIESVLDENEVADAESFTPETGAASSMGNPSLSGKDSHDKLQQSKPEQPTQPSHPRTSRQAVGVRNPFFSCDPNANCTTVAVRGATVARPQPHETLRRSRRRQRRRGPGDAVTLGQNTALRPLSPRDFWIQQNQRQLAMLQKLRLDVLFEILPKVVKERAQHPLPQRALCYGADDDNPGSIPSQLSESAVMPPLGHFVSSISRNVNVTSNKGFRPEAPDHPPWMAMEFLNALRTRAVCLKTPAFACGMVAQPITIFLIGIATEDGVFISGLNQRLELGHMYRPNSNIEGNDGVASSNSTRHQDFVIANNSSACMATDVTAIEALAVPASPSSAAATRKTMSDIQPPSSDAVESDSQVLLSSRAKQQFENDGTSGISTNASETSKGNGSIGMMGFYSDSDDSSNDEALSERGGDDDSSSECLSSSSSSSLSDILQESEVLRGRTGPGRWHCYTAIYDGEKSELRVDGLKENIGPPNFSQAGLLDGLTLGSDHKYHLSLCCGNGADFTTAISGEGGEQGGADDGDGEGEGAIAEVAAFKGRLPIEDVLTMEKHLMRKHGIPFKCHDDWKVDDIRRQVTYLMSRPPAKTSYSSVGTMAESRVPLKYMAQHPSVSWYKEHPITGAKVQIKRIGCRTGDNSSDW